MDHGYQEKGGGTNSFMSNLLSICLSPRDFFLVSELISFIDVNIDDMLRVSMRREEKRNLENGLAITIIPIQNSTKQL